ncbi:MAG: AEC family transporter [Lachnospiraceae bacterium]|nr:AEC family transporter [Lachnospiraceae bacterium]
MTLLLIEKIFSLFLILFLGAVIVKVGVLKSEDSKVLSAIVLYIATPCAIITSFEVDVTDEVVSGLLMAFSAALAIHAILLLLTIPMRKVLKMDSVEILSVIYSNAANLIIPIVSAVLGSEWVVYSCAYVSVQLFFLWSHAKSTIREEKGIDIKKILLNVNMISVFLGIIIFLTGFRFPGPLQDTMESLSSMIGPTAMLVTGMIIGSKPLKNMLIYKRLPLIVALRLIVVPLIVLSIIKFTNVASLIPEGETVLLITLLATTTPSASTITQMSVVYEKDADYAGAINVFTTLGCIITMPIIVALYRI